MAFHFSLEPVLRLKRGQERVERLKLEAIHSEQAQTRAKLDDVTQRYFESRRRFERELAGTLSGSELHFESARDAGVTAARLALEARLAEIEQRHWAQMQVYTKVRRSRETFENLRDRKFELYRVEESRREQQVLDDLFLARRERVREE